jgi:hypothetical protein
MRQADERPPKISRRMRRLGKVFDVMLRRSVCASAKRNHLERLMQSA